MKKITEQQAEVIAATIANYFTADLSSKDTAQEQIKLISHIIHLNTLVEETFRNVWKNVGIGTKLVDDGKFYSQIMTDLTTNKELENNEIQEIHAEISLRILKKLVPTLLPETKILGKRVYPEYSIW